MIKDEDGGGVVGEGRRGNQHPLSRLSDFFFFFSSSSVTLTMGKGHRKHNERVKLDIAAHRSQLQRSRLTRENDNSMVSVKAGNVAM